MKPERIQFRFSFLPDAWQLEPATGDSGPALSRTYDFGDFVNAVDFLGTVAAHGLELKHYPEVEINGGEVFVRLTGPGKEGLSDEIFELAEAMDRAA